MSVDKRRIVEGLDDLKAILAELGGRGEFFIMLAGGKFRSSKTIVHDPAKGTWWVYNHIDDTEQNFANDEGLLDRSRTHIGLALERRALGWDGY